MADASDPIVLRRYLLGDLPEPARSDLEARLWENDEVQDTLDLLEDDLIEEYVRGDLPAADRAVFETRLASSPRLRGQIEVTRAFHRLAQTESDARSSHPGSAGATATPGRATSWIWPLALAACLLLSVAGHLYLWMSASTKARQAEARVAGLERELHARDVELLALAKPSVDLPGMFVLPLPPAAATRSSSTSPEFRIPSGMQTVLLRVPIPSGEPSTRFSLTVMTTAGDTVWEASPISPDPSLQTVSVFVPVRALAGGRYKASLFDARPGERTEIAYFVFSIVP